MFKRRPHLLRFAARYPGGLTAHFLNQVRVRLNCGLAASTEELAQTDVGTWAATLTELRDVRDQKEVAFLGRILGEVSRGRLPEAMDLLVMRIREVKQAKREGSSWEKAGVLSLVPGAFAANAALPDGGLHL